MSDTIDSTIFPESYPGKNFINESEEHKDIIINAKKDYENDTENKIDIEDIDIFPYVSEINSDIIFEENNNQEEEKENIIKEQIEEKEKEKENKENEIPYSVYHSTIQQNNLNNHIPYIYTPPLHIPQHNSPHTHTLTTNIYAENNIKEENEKLKEQIRKLTIEHKKITINGDKFMKYLKDKLLQNTRQDKEVMIGKFAELNGVILTEEDLVSFTLDQINEIYSIIRNTKLQKQKNMYIEIFCILIIRCAEMLGKYLEIDELNNISSCIPIDIFTNDEDMLQSFDEVAEYVGFKPNPFVNIFILITKKIIIANWGKLI